MVEVVQASEKDFENRQEAVEEAWGNARNY